MGKLFDTIFESAMSRYQRGGFLVGDVLKFEKNFKSTDEYKELGANVKELIDKMIDTGMHIRVVGINNEYPSQNAGDPANSNGKVSLNIAVDVGGGRYVDYCTIPSKFVQPDSSYPNLPSIPDAFRRKDKVTIKPEPVEPQDHISNKTDKGDGKLSNSEITLPTDNVKIPAASAPTDTSYTAQYLS